MHAPAAFGTTLRLLFVSQKASGLVNLGSSSKIIICLKVAKNDRIFPIERKTFILKFLEGGGGAHVERQSLFCRTLEKKNIISSLPFPLFLYLSHFWLSRGVVLLFSRLFFQLWKWIFLFLFLMAYSFSLSACLASTIACLLAFFDNVTKRIFWHAKSNNKTTLSPSSSVSGPSWSCNLLTIFWLAWQWKWWWSLSPKYKLLFRSFKIQIVFSFQKPWRSNQCL